MGDQLDQIIGQPLAVNQLRSLTKSNRIPHALLFTGPPGVGKYHTALQFIKLLNSEKHQKKVENLDEPFIKYILPLPRGKGEVSESSGTAKLDDKQIAELKEQLSEKIKNPFHRIRLEGANFVKISSIREIRKFLTLDFNEIKYRFVIIDSAHLMNKEAQNALLKSLEEPPQGVIFILLTPFEENLLPTIRSRCWEIKFKNLQSTEISELLKLKFNVSEEEAVKVAHFSNGSVHTALDMLETELSQLLDSTIKILRFSMAGWYNSAYIEIKHATDEFEFVKVKDLISLILRWLNDVQKNRSGIGEYYFDEFKDTIEKFNSKFSHTRLTDVYARIEELEQSMDKNILLNLIILNLIFLLHSIVIRK